MFHSTEYNGLEGCLVLNIFLACSVLSFYEPNKKVFYWKYQRFCCTER